MGGNWGEPRSTIKKGKSVISGMEKNVNVGKKIGDQKQRGRDGEGASSGATVPGR